jgi:hypothetical protein
MPPQIAQQEMELEQNWQNMTLCRTFDGNSKLEAFWLHHGLLKMRHPVSSTAQPASGTASLRRVPY